VRVPDAAKAGKAKVTLSFADWKEAKVAPATLDITVVDVTPDEEARSDREAKERAAQVRRLEAAQLQQRADMLKQRMAGESDATRRRELEEKIGRLEKQVRDLEGP
jgi:hypothetical protein